MKQEDATPKRVVVDKILGRISPNHPGNSPTPLGLLGLDAYAKTFCPVNRSAKYPVDDQAAVRTVDTLWHVMYMLLDNDLHACFLRDVSK
ncbi:hypothetical protein ColLi_12145 [Colletotrichum liriopes]|uniref:Uncharacterized protein n=1 Tax=Colletotrichum liriopes TaxID=708192 RepID=A0AA37LYD7_9PEZI|nr:hypothetical protein ColLi_12145 [Colletotrichum liriopes]